MAWTRILLAAGVAATLAACQEPASRATGGAATPPAAPPSPTQPSSTQPSAMPSVTPGAYGDLQFGMTPQEAEKLLQRPLRGINAAEEREPCHYLFPDGDPRATFALMVSDGRVARIDVSSPAVPTAEGAKVGDSEEQVTQLYAGRAEVTPHKYRGPEDHYITVYDQDRTHALVFETRNGVIAGYHAGRLPEAQYVEGCS